MDKTDCKIKKVKVRGTGTYDPETKKFGFEPFNEAPSTQQNVKTCAGGGKRWTTTGAAPSDDDHPEEQGESSPTSMPTLSISLTC